MNLKFLIFLTLKNIFIINRQINCPSFKCSSKGMKDKKCFSSIEEYSDGEVKSTIYLSQCKKEEKCTQTSWDPSIGICSSNIRKSFGGETCKSDADCYSQACDSHNFCQDKKINEKCSNDKQCCKECVCIFDPLNGESENDKTCRALVKLGDKCILDETDKSGLHSNCPIFSVCSNFLSTPDATNGVCVEQNSLDIGTNATNFHACKGNNIILLKDGYYVCSNISSTGRTCENARDQSLECTNEIIVKKGQEVDPMEKMIQSQGICRCDIDGKKHCQVIGGLKFDYYINLIRKKLNNKNIIPQNFHVSAFRETFNDYEIAEAFFNYKYDGTKADLCTKKYFIDNLLLAFEKESFYKANNILLLLIIFFYI